MDRVREPNSSIDQDVPAGDVLWRYLDFAKFVSMLKEGALWFCRADLLGDPLEGSLTRARQIERQQLLENPPDGRTRQDLEDALRHNARMRGDFRPMIYVNCWHRGDHESMALWRGYGNGDYAVAVRTTFGQLDSVLPTRFQSSYWLDHANLTEADSPAPRTMPIYLTKIRYIDHTSTVERTGDESNLLSPFTFKSLAYSHENEVRALYWNIPGFDAEAQRYRHPAGFLVPVDLGELVSEVVISPLAPAWFTALVEDCCKRYGLSVSVRASFTSSPPIY